MSERNVKRRQCKNNTASYYESPERVEGKRRKIPKVVSKMLRSVTEKKVEVRKASGTSERSEEEDSDSGYFKCTFSKCRKKRFKSKGGLTHHMHTHDVNMPGESTIICYVCDIIFQYPCELEKHKINCHRAKSDYQCDTCKKYFKAPCELQAHVRAHKGEKNYACPECEKKFVTKNQLSVHVLRYHTPDGDRHRKCRECEKSIPSWKALEKHKQEFHSEMNVCQECGKSFGSKFNLDHHLRTVHSDEKTFGCVTCGKNFKTKYDWKSHIVMHEGTNTFECQECEKTFKRKTDLKSHSKTHESEAEREERLTKCKVCKKLVTNITRHKKIHDPNRKMFSCKFCTKSYKSLQMLELHVARKHS